MEFKEGHHYVIEFLDHAIGEKVIDEPLICNVSGWIIKDAEEYVVLTTWLVVNNDEAMVKDNYEPVSIIKCAIKDWHQII